MRFPFRNHLFWATVAILMFLAWASISTWWARRPEQLFRRIVTDPIPSSVKIQRVDYVLRREWRAFLHIQLSPKDFELLRTVKAYRQLEGDSYEDFLRSTYQQFKTMLPLESALAGYDVFEAFDERSGGTFSYFIVNKTRSEGFIIALRY
jgi:hypothetical protein